MSKRDSKKKTELEIEEPKLRTGHYNFHNGKCRFDTRPKRQRTRGDERRNWQKED